MARFSLRVIRRPDGRSGFGDDAMVKIMGRRSARRVAQGGAMSKVGREPY